MKPIETVYKGYRFRSRLEARWAVFFDVQGIKWEYEKEGFEFEDGTRYLPDFWLSQAEMWAEVKPTELTEDEMKKVILLARETNRPCLLLIGSPEVKAYCAVFRVDPEFYNGEDINEGRTSIAQPILLVMDYMYAGFYSFPCESEIDDIEGMFGSGKLYTSAVIAARSARFEFSDKCKL